MIVQNKWELVPQTKEKSNIIRAKFQTFENNDLVVARSVADCWWQWMFTLGRKWMLRRPETEEYSPGESTGTSVAVALHPEKILVIRAAAR